MGHDLTRRALLGAGPATLALPVALAAAPGPNSADTPILRLYREHEALEARINDLATPRDVGEALFPAYYAMEQRMVEEPATCLADLAAKVLVLTDLRDETSNIYEPALRAEMEALVAQARARRL